MKWIIRIVGALVILVLIAAITIPFIYKDKIVAIVKEEANKNLNAEVDFGDFDLTILTSFPNLTFTIENVSLKNKAPFDGTYLAKIGEFSTTLDIMKVIGGEYVINSISIANADFNIKVLKNGAANYDITLPSTDTSQAEEPTEESTPFKLALNKYSLNNVNFIYDDKLYATYIKMEGLNHTGSGDFTLDDFILKTQSNINAFTMAYDGLTYLNKTKVDMKADIGINMPQFKFTFNQNQIVLNQLKLKLDGWLALPADPIDMDLKISAPDNTFKSLLSLIPAVYSKEFEDIQTSGNFTFNANFKGTYHETQLPMFTILLKVADGRFNYPDLPKSAENIQIDLAIQNPDGVEDHTEINLNKFHVELGDNPVDFSMKLTKPISDPYFTGQIQSQINFESLADVIPLDEGQKFLGTVTADMKFNGAMSALENEKYDQFAASGQMILTGLNYQDNSLPYQINIASAYFTFSPEKMALSNTKITVGKSDFELNGFVANYLPYYLNNKVLEGNLTLKSKTIDANEFLTDDEETENNSIAQNNQETESEMEVIEIPENLNLTFSAQIAKLIYDNITMTNLNGKVEVKNKQAQLNNFKMNMLQGEVGLAGLYDASNTEKPTAAFNFQLNKVNIKETFTTFNTIQKMAPIAENATGLVSANFSLSTNLLQNMEPDLNSMSGAGSLQTFGVSVSGTKVTQKIADVLKNEKYNKLELNNTSISFRFADGKITTQPFDIALAGQKATVSGASYFDQRIDYLIATKVPQSAFGNAATQTMNNLLGQVKKSTGVDIKPSDQISLELVIGGKMDDPTVKPRVSGFTGDNSNAVNDVKEAVKQKVDEKVKEVKEDLNKKIAEERAKLIKQATEKGDQLVAEAQKQAQNLNAQAKTAGDKLRQEAKTNGEKLMSEAGSNPIKKAAAKATADKLNAEADAKAKQLANEASKKGTDLVNKAQAEKQHLIREAETKEISVK